MNCGFSQPEERRCSVVWWYVTGGLCTPCRFFQSIIQKKGTTETLHTDSSAMRKFTVKALMMNLWSSHFFKKIKINY